MFLRRRGSALSPRPCRHSTPSANASTLGYSQALDLSVAAGLLTSSLPYRHTSCAAGPALPPGAIAEALLGRHGGRLPMRHTSALAAGPDSATILGISFQRQLFCCDDWRPYHPPPNTGCHPHQHTRAPAGDQRTRKMGIIVAISGAFLNAAQFVTVNQIGTALSSSLIAWTYHTAVLIASGASLLLQWPLPPVVPCQHDWLMVGGGHPTAWWLLAWLRPRHRPAGAGRAAHDAVSAAPTAPQVGGLAAATYVGQLMLSRGLQLGSPGKLSAINSSQILYSYLWEVLLLHGALNLCAIAGALFIVLGVVVVCLPFGEDKQLRAPPQPNGAQVQYSQLPGERQSLAAAATHRLLPRCPCFCEPTCLLQPPMPWHGTH